MKCTQVLKHIPLLIGGDLDAETERLLREHLAGCLGCYREYQESLQAHDNLRALREKPDLAPILHGLAQDVLLDLHEAPVGPAAGIPRPMFAGAFRFAAAAAVLAILIGGAFMLGRSFDEQPGRSGDPVETVRTMPRTDAGRSAYPAGVWTDESIPFGENDRPDLIRLNPNELPTIQPADRRKGF
jgi:hypothetical protein